MSDLELLKHAAQAAGLSGDWTETIGGWPALAVNGSVYKVWQPLHDNGDALALAVKLGISVSFAHSTQLSWDSPAIVEVGAFAGWCPTFTEVNHDDWAAATRRAIVRAAAAIQAPGATQAAPANPSTSASTQQ